MVVFGMSISISLPAGEAALNCITLQPKCTHQVSSGFVFRKDMESISSKSCRWFGKYLAMTKNKTFIVNGVHYPKTNGMALQGQMEAFGAGVSQSPSASTSITCAGRGVIT